MMLNLNQHKKKKEKTELPKVVSTPKELAAQNEEFRKRIELLETENFNLKQKVKDLETKKEQVKEQVKEEIKEEIQEEIQQETQEESN